MLYIHIIAEYPLILSYVGYDSVMFPDTIRYDQQCVTYYNLHLMISIVSIAIEIHFISATPALLCRHGKVQRRIQLMTPVILGNYGNFNTWSNRNTKICNNGFVLV